MQTLKRSPQMSPVTETQVDAWFRQNEGLCGTKDLNGVHTRLTTSALHLMPRKFRFCNEIIDKTDFEVLENEEIAEIYRNNEQKALSEHWWAGVAPAIWKGEGVFAYGIDRPIENKEKKVIGVFWNITIIQDKKIYEFFDQLTTHKIQLTPTAISGFEVGCLQHEITLTLRESECLFLTLHGKTAKAIAHVLKISPKTVEFHLAHLKAKFNVYSKSELISKAIEQGFLQHIPASLCSQRVIEQM